MTILIIVGLLSTIIPILNLVSFASAALPYSDVSGTLSGGNYTIRFPNPIANWNKGLIIWIKGYEHTLSSMSTLLTPINAFTNYSTSMGYALALSDEGSGGSYVQKFMNSNYELTQYIINTYNVTGKIFLVGASQGGGVALLLGAKYPKLYSGVLDLSGIKDVANSYNWKMGMINANDSERIAKLQAIGATIPPQGSASMQAYIDSANLTSQDIALAEGGTPVTSPQMYQADSPTYHANISIPVITLHGTSDASVPYAEALDYKAAIASAGCSRFYRLIPIVGGQHVTDPPVRDERFTAFSMLLGWSESLTGTPIDNSITYSNGYGSATISIPNTGNITQITVSAQHVGQGTQGTPDILELALSSPQAKGSVNAVYSTNPNTASFEWFRQNSFNGSTRYTEVNGTIIINNFFQLLPNELTVQRNGTHTTADYNPKTPYPITLPPDLFPLANFSSTWTMPAFHIELDASGSLTEAKNNGTTVSGWTITNQYYTYAFANATFTCPAWNNYQTTGTSVIVRPIYVTMNKAPNYNPAKIQTDLSNALIVCTDSAITTNTVFQPQSNITQMTINWRHFEQGPFGSGDYLLLSPSGSQFGSKNAQQTYLYTYSNPQAIQFYKSIWNGSRAYNEVDGKVLIGNLFFGLGPNELKTQQMGDTITIDFNPATPKTIMLDPALFPLANFSSTWTVPAFHAEFKTTGNLTLTSTPLSLASGWKVAENFITYTVNSTVTFPSWNVTATDNTGNGRTITVQAYTAPPVQLPLTGTVSSISSSVTTGATVTFTVNASGGIAPYTYQWYEGTTALSGQTTPQLNITKNTAGTYTYFCQVTDAIAMTTNTTTTTLTVSPIPTPTPTPVPTSAPTPVPTLVPTPKATSTPTPTTAPTTSPTESPTTLPTTIPQEVSLQTAAIATVTVVAIIVIIAAAVVVLQKRAKRQ